MSRPHSVSPVIRAKRSVGWVWGKSLQTPPRKEASACVAVFSSEVGMDPGQLPGTLALLLLDTIVLSLAHFAGQRNSFCVFPHSWYI